MAPLLEVKKLTMRFGGLTAVNDVSFAVEKGQIFSIIGPNGAGKTTVFNAVTGVYEPTEGEVLFDGGDPRRPFGAKVVAGVSLIGLLTAFALALFSSNVDAAWRASIVRNYQDTSEPFPVGRALGDLWDFLNARVMAERETSKLVDLEVRERNGKWRIRSSNRAILEEHDDEEVANRRLEVLSAMVNLAGSLATTKEMAGKWVVHGPDKTPLETFKSRDEARQRLLDLAIKAGKLKWRLVNRASAAVLAIVPTPEKAEEERKNLDELLLMGASVPAEERDGKGVLLSSDRSRVLATFDTKADADERVKELAAVSGGVLAARIILWLSFFGGLALGAGGAYVVWHRARRTPDVIARNGLARTFQNIRLFPDMLVVENVLMGMDSRLKSYAWQAAVRLPSFLREEREATARALELLEFVGLRERAWQIAKSLPYGDMRRLEIARALATQPKLVLLDEPAAGMNPAESIELTKLITKIRDTGVTVILIEHHMKVVMPISDKIVVLEYGNKIAEGTPAEVKANPKVIEAYLGKEEVT